MRKGDERRGIGRSNNCTAMPSAERASRILLLMLPVCRIVSPLPHPCCQRSVSVGADNANGRGEAIGATRPIVRVADCDVGFHFVFAVNGECLAPEVVSLWILPRRIVARRTVQFWRPTAKTLAGIALRVLTGRTLRVCPVSAGLLGIHLHQWRFRHGFF
jgi:hypothetical protein